VGHRDLVNRKDERERGHDMTTARTIAAALLLVLMAAALGAQDTKTTGRELTIEEQYLQKSIALQIMRAQAYASDEETKQNVLNDIASKVAKGTLGSERDDVETILEYLAMEGSSHVVREGLRQVNNFPMVRRQATELLGQIGTEQAKNTLISVLLNDEEYMVKAQAAYALGQIGLNKDNEVAAALAYAVNREDLTRSDNNWAIAMVLAFQKLNQNAPGGLKYPEAFRALIKISQGSFVTTVKQKALQVLEEMKK
jgi:hypothetical protein